MSRTLVLSLVSLFALGGCPATDDGSKDETGDPDSGVDTDTTDTGLLGDTGLDTGDTDIDYDYTWPSSAEAYTFEDVSYLYQLRIPASADACCRDFGAISANGTGKNDNALAGLNLALKLAGLDLNNELAAVVESGLFVGLLDHRSMPAGDGPYALAFFLGAFDDGTFFSSAAAGTGEFLADPQSFIDGTGEPQVAFVPAIKKGTTVTASGDDFPITVAFGGAALSLPVKDVLIEGELSQTAAGTGISDGTLSGYVEVGDFLGAWQDLAEGSCGCTTVPTDLFTQNSNGKWVANCPSSATVIADCQDDENDFLCATILGDDAFNNDTRGFCKLLSGTLETVADIDTDGNSRDYEALSLGLRVRAAPGEVTGLAEESVLQP